MPVFLKSNGPGSFLTQQTALNEPLSSHETTKHWQLETNHWHWWLEKTVVILQLWIWNFQHSAFKSITTWVWAHTKNNRRMSSGFLSKYLLTLNFLTISSKMKICDWIIDFSNNMLLLMYLQEASFSRKQNVWTCKVLSVHVRSDHGLSKESSSGLRQWCVCMCTDVEGTRWKDVCDRCLEDTFWFERNFQKMRRVTAFFTPHGAEAANSWSVLDTSWFQQLISLSLLSAGYMVCPLPLSTECDSLLGLINITAGMSHLEFRIIYWWQQRVFDCLSLHVT